jgi:hypothetical protein
MEAVERGDLHLDVLRELEWSHLMHLCPTCRAGAQDWLERAQRRPAERRTALQVLPFILARHTADADETARQAERDLRDLLQLPQAERLTKIERAQRRFRGVLLAHRLLNEAKRRIPEQPQEAHDLAETAEKVLLRTPHRPGYFDALTRATAYRANALRACGKLCEAAERMACARSLLRHQHVTELLVYAELDWMEGILRKDERRFQEAEALLSRSAALFDLAQERIEAARPLLTLGLAYYDQQELAKAIETTEAALAFLKPESEPRLYLCGRHNLALFYVESGRYEAAAVILAADEALYQEFPDRWTSLRKLWLAGKIAMRTEDLAEAEEAFLQVRSGFLDQGIGYDAAMVSLDLALLYLRQNRTVELRALAEEMHAVFASEDVHREAVAALLLFQEAARREALTAEMVEEMIVYLKRAQGNPAMRFQGGG